MRQQPPTMVVREACYTSHYWEPEIIFTGIPIVNIEKKL